MFVYVDLEHDRLRDTPDLWQHFSTKTLEIKYRLEKIAGEPCLIVRYNSFTPSLLRNLDIWAVVVGGQYTALPHYDEAELTGLRALFLEATWPTIALCGGFQLMAQTYGAELAPMNTPSLDASSFSETPIPPDMSNPSPETTAPEARQERGFMPVQVTEPHPIFDGMEDNPVFFQLHSWEVKSVPDGFRLLAESPLCQVQMIGHRQAPLFGVQFHAEQYNETHPDGRTLLDNFFKIARNW